METGTEDFQQLEAVLARQLEIQQQASVAAGMEMRQEILGRPDRKRP